MIRLIGVFVLALSLESIRAVGQTNDVPDSNPSPPVTQTNLTAQESKVLEVGERLLPWEKGFVKVGGFVTFFDSTVSFGLDNAPGVNISAEDTLGLNSTLTVFRVEAMYRPGKSRRHQLDFYYVSFHRSGEATLSKDLEIDGITYPVGAHVESTFNFDIIQGTYSYALIQNQRLRIALGLGVYAVPLKYGLDVTTTGGFSAVEGANTTLPLPALAMRAEFQLFPRLYLNAAINGMYLEISDFKGSLVDLNVGMEYRPWKHLSLGLAYSFMSVNVDAESSRSEYPGANFIGSVDVRYSGLMLYGGFSF